MATSSTKVKAKRCKYCGSPLAEDGFCSKPCKPGDLERKLAVKPKQS